MAVWAAALALCAARARAGCFAAASALVAAARRLSQSSGAQRAAALVRQVTNHAMWLMRKVLGGWVHLRCRLCRCRCLLACGLQSRAQRNSVTSHEPTLQWAGALEAAVEHGLLDGCTLQVRAQPAVVELMA